MYYAYNEYGGLCTMDNDVCLEDKNHDDGKQVFQKEKMMDDGRTSYFIHNTLSSMIIIIH